MNVKGALQMLKQQGYKYTDKRKDILEFFFSTTRYMTAKDVLSHLKDDYPGLSFDTIYRNLSLFADLGILEMTELEGEKHFRFRCSTNEHHHHFICTDCGKTERVDLCPMREMPQLNGYDVTGHKFEIYGRCPECAAE